MSSAPMDDQHHADLQRSARDHLWMHFTRMSSYAEHDVPVIVRGEGSYIYDSRGKKYLDALSGLFVSQLGHGRTDLVAGRETFVAAQAEGIGSERLDAPGVFARRPVEAR